MAVLALSFSGSSSDRGKAMPLQEGLASPQLHFNTVSRASPPPSPHPQLWRAAWTLLRWEGSTRNWRYPTTLPAGSAERDPHPAPLPPTSTQLFSFTSHFPLLLLFFAASPAAPCFLLPLYHTSYSTFALSLLLTICISSSQLSP